MPVHVLLFNGQITDALIMTSGNRADEPICDNGENARLGSVDASCFMTARS